MHLETWQPIVQAVIAAASSGSRLPPEVNEVLKELAATADWSQLVTTIRRVLAGDRDRDTLLTGLDSVDTAILTAILDRLPT